jgi:hypothetical protein
MSEPKPMFNYAAYVSERTQDFSGREWVFDSIDGWLGKPSGSRTFLLTGEPGCGKTAVAARLYEFSRGETTPPNGLAQLRRDFLAATHFCSARDRRWISPHTFAESLALQLAARYDAFAKALVEKASDRQIRIEVDQRVGELRNGHVVGVQIARLDARATTPEDAFIRIVREPLEALLDADPDVRPVVLVDALDEALLYSGDVGIVQLLAQAEELPPEVRVIVTSRRDGRIENLFPNADGLFLSAQERDEQNRGDVDRFIAHRFQHDARLVSKVAAIAPHVAADVARTLADRASGNFQYLRFLLDAVADGRRSLEEIRDLPELSTGLDALYYLYFDSLGRAIKVGKRDWTNDYAPVLQTLSAAQEPLAREQLRALSGQADSVLWRHLTDLEQFIETVGSENGGGARYRLYHQSFADFLSRPALQMPNRQLRNDYLLARHEAHGRIADELLERHGGRWESCTDRYALRYVATHLAAAANTDDSRERHRRTSTVVDVTSGADFQAAHARVLDDKTALRRDLERALRVAAQDLDSGAPPVVVHGALALVHLRQQQLRPESIFELARQGKLEAAVRHLALLGPEPTWRQAVQLTLTWLAAATDRNAAQELRDQVAAEPLAAPLQLLLARIDAALTNGPPPALPELPHPPTSFEIEAILDRLGGGNVTGVEPLDWEAIQAAGPGEAQAYLAEQDGPPLVAFALADTIAGTLGFQRYISIHAANAYEYYRNRSLWSLIEPVLRHPDPVWARERLIELEIAALGGTSVQFREALPLAMLALRARAGEPDVAKELNDRTTEAETAATGLSATGLLLGRGEGDPWGQHLRRLAALAEIHARAGDAARASALLDHALSLPFGFAGFRAPACLSAAEAADIVRPGDRAAVDHALDAALDAAHNVQDTIFCARMTSRVNAMRERWWALGAPAMADTADRFTREPSAPEFAGLHQIGETYSRRRDGPEKLPLAPLARTADTLDALAVVYGRSATEFAHLNRAVSGAPSAPLEQNAKVAVPDAEFAPLLAARFAAAVLCDATLSNRERVELIQLLAPIAVADPTALDTVLARLLIAALTSDHEALKDLEATIDYYKPTSVTAGVLPSVLTEGRVP